MINRPKPTLLTFVLVFTLAFVFPGVFFPGTAAAASPSVSTETATDISDDSATLNGSIDDNDEDISEFGFYYSSDRDDLADTSDISGDSESLDGDYDDFDLELSDLDEDTTYYYRAYAIYGDDDDEKYGGLKSFTTDESGSDLSSDGDLEAVTDDADNVEGDEATLQAYVDGYDEDDFDINEYGFFYGTDEGDVDDVESILEDGDDNWDCEYDRGDDYDSSEDEFEFSLSLSDLDEGETYYYRAYIEYENEDGDEYYSLGDIEEFDAAGGSGSSSGKASIFTIGSKVYNLRGSSLVMDVAPYAKDNRTYLPVRYVAYAMGLTDSQIRWSPLIPQTVTLTNGTNTVILNIGSKIMYANGKPMTMDVAPEVSNNRTCLPIAWVASAFGAKATWDGDRTVTITGGSGSSSSSEGDVSLDDDSLTMSPGDEETITGTLDADGLEIDDVDWDIDGDDVVSVDIDIDGDEFDAVVEVDDSADDGDECTITFTVTDEDGNEYEAELNVSVEDDSDVVVKTLSASSIGEDSATLNGEVTDDGGLDIEEFGFYYGTSKSEVADGEDGNSDVEEADGDADDFSLDLEDLDSGETYYFMAYAIDEDDDITYGSVKSFETD